VNSTAVCESFEGQQIDCADSQQSTVTGSSRVHVFLLNETAAHVLLYSCNDVVLHKGFKGLEIYCTVTNRWASLTRLKK